MIERRDITGIVLCGGSGRRMGGRDKPLEEFAGKPLVAHVVARLTPQVIRIVISCGRNEQHYARWSDTVVVDDVAGEGPLRGLLTVLGAINTPYAFVCPGDAPLLSTSLVSILSNAWSDNTVDACLPHDGIRSQHLFLLLRVALRDKLRNYLEGGGRSVQSWVDTLHTVSVDASAARDSFVNVNSQDDLKALNALLVNRC
jgi:molybdopterin-guanine dinucleotide biosynthesis protein A